MQLALLASTQVHERLLTVIGPDRDFEGKLTPQGFRVRRNVRSWGRDPYHPLIDGTLADGLKGTDVKLTFRASAIGVAEGVVLFGFVEYLALSRDISMWWWPLAAFVFTHIGLCLLSFAPGQRWSESRIRQVLAT
jgi:hypothetical protein